MEQPHLFFCTVGDSAVIEHVGELLFYFQHPQLTGEEYLCQCLPDDTCDNSHFFSIVRTRLYSAYTSKLSPVYMSRLNGRRIKVLIPRNGMAYSTLCELAAEYSPLLMGEITATPRQFNLRLSKEHLGRICPQCQQVNTPSVNQCHCEEHTTSSY